VAKHTSQSMAAVSTRPADERELLSACPALAGTPLADLRSSDVKKKLLSMPVSHIFPGTRANEALTAAVAAGRARVSRASSEGSTSDADDAGLSAVIETLANLLSAPALKDERSSAAARAEVEGGSPPPRGLPRVLSSHSLSARLKSGTADAHKDAENVQYVRSLLRGKVSRQQYALLLRDLHHVYVALEAALDAAADRCEAVRAIHFPSQLGRREALALDLEAHAGGGWRETLGPPSPPCAEYVARITELGASTEASEAALLVAHAYTRYLGDLSGGQIIAKALRRHYGADAAMHFYRFDAIASPSAFKKVYRRALDELMTSSAAVDAEALVAEANAAFSFNARIFRHLDAVCGLAAPAPSPSAAAPEVATAAAAAPASAAAANLPVAVGEGVSVSRPRGRALLRFEVVPQWTGDNFR